MGSAELFFIALSILILIAIAVIFFINADLRKEIDSITGLAFGLILIGMFFTGPDRFIGYGLMTAGVILAIVDAVLKVRKAGES
jgi:amino acid transporter